MTHIFAINFPLCILFSSAKNESVRKRECWKKFLKTNSFLVRRNNWWNNWFHIEPIIWICEFFIISNNLEEKRLIINIEWTTAMCDSFYCTQVENSHFEIHWQTEVRGKWVMFSKHHKQTFRSANIPFNFMSNLNDDQFIPMAWNTLCVMQFLQTVPVSHRIASFIHFITFCQVLTAFQCTICCLN